MEDIININDLKKIIKEFTAKRDWEKFHDPKNLSMSVACEAGELLEIFQWMTSNESLVAHKNEAIKEKAAQELSDIFLNLIRIADLMNINVHEAIIKKIELNNKKYPKDKVMGSLDFYFKNHGITQIER